MPVTLPRWDPQNYFRAWERTIDSWDSLLGEIEHSKVIAGTRKLVWRGVHNDSYGLLSSAYRRLQNHDGNVPSEKRMRELEVELLKTARTLWADRGGSALETLAHIQHYGGPTRLIDVSHAPLVAVFFATEKKFDQASRRPLEDEDGRLFAFQADSRTIELDHIWGTRDLPWLNGEDSVPGWETDLPFVWDPPRALNERISAQQGAFLVGGVPSFPHGQNSRYRMPGSWVPGAMTTMPAAEVRKVASVSVFLKSLERKTNADSQAAYTWRITAQAKSEIREKLRTEYKLMHGTIYPDLYGLATYGADFAELT